MDKTFIGKCEKCGKTPAAIVDGSAGTNEAVTYMVRGGLKVELVDGPVTLSACTCEK